MRGKQSNQGKSSGIKKFLLIIVVCVPVIALVAWAILTFGIAKGFKYETTMDGNIEVTGTWFKKTNLDVPSTILGKSVTEVSSVGSPSLVRLNLPETINRIYPQEWSSYSNLQEINVDRGNPSFSSQDEVLFSNTLNYGGTVMESDMAELLF